MKEDLHAVIGVWFRDDGVTFYVKRSAAMQNYPSVWSLLSVQFEAAELPDPLDLEAARPIIQRISNERLGGVPVLVLHYITSGTCSDNPMRQRVFLHLYRIDLPTPPVLNPEFYEASEWLTPEEYERRAAGLTCGLCMRLWSDYLFRRGLTSRRFAPLPPEPA